MKHRLWLLTALIAWLTAPLPAQSPGAAIPTALRVATSRPGGCSLAPDLSTARIAAFPEVRFTRGHCVLEHGDPVTSIVGLDADSVLYLLSSKDDFNFLVARHPPAPLDSAVVIAYALVALELSGATSGGSTQITRPEQLPAMARDSIWARSDRLVSVSPSMGGRMWRVTLLIRGERGYYEPPVVLHTLVLHTDGRLLFAETRILWSDPTHV